VNIKENNNNKKKDKIYRTKDNIKQKIEIKIRHKKDRKRIKWNIK
jgi:hypothetical protein